VQRDTPPPPAATSVHTGVAVLLRWVIPVLNL
jgi:hypothetical protein